MSEHETAPRARPLPMLTLPGPTRDRRGLVVSLLFHGLLVAAVVVGGLTHLDDRPRVAGDGSFGLAGGGGGGGSPSVAYIALPSAADAAPAAVAPEPAVVPPPQAPKEEVEEAAVVPPPADVAVGTPAASDSASTGAGSGTGSGTGAGRDGGSGGGTGGGEGTGTGLGAGPGTGGDSTDILPPQLRNWVPPTERPPKELRGHTVKVTFWITADGRVEKFVTDPEIRDRDYLEKFTEIVMKTRFRPARTRVGVPVAVVYSMDFMLQAGS